MDIHTAPMAKFVFLLVLLSQAASGKDSDVVRVHPGENVTLPCEAADVSIRAVEWTRPDLSPDNVLFYCDGRSDTTHQHSSFEGRVQLVDSELKDGDVSLILRNVSSNDIGTYECRVARGGSRRKRAIIKTEPIRSIQLEFTDSGSKSGNPVDGNQINGNPVDGNHTRSYVALGAVFVLVCFTVVGFFVAWKYKRHMDKKSEPSAADEAVDDQLI